jgi:protein-S-isoprenylcysteine O-methyltransferase Ste14
MFPYTAIIAGCWIAFLAWLFLPRLVNRDTPQRFSNRYMGQASIVAVVAIAIFIAIGHVSPGFLVLRIVPDTTATGVLGVTLTILGLGFSAWSRYHLGKNWSSFVRIRKDHQLITTGPYRYVRNPMYTGMLLAFVGAAIAIGEMLILPAFIIGFVSIWLKIKAEEELLQETFGEEYATYCRSVKALIPAIL